jgi:hypothetical protein
MKPWSPQHVVGSRDDSNNLTITWKRRTRMNGEWIDGGDVALGETTEAYVCQILDAPDGDVVRTISGITSETTTYSASDQTTDFGSPQAIIYVKVMQVSTVVGNGFGTEATV